MNPEQTIVLYQPLLQSIAYNLVRCKADAEDIVQETFLRWLTIDQEKIENTKAYLIRAVTNNCLNHLNSLRKKKEEYLETINSSEFVQRLKEVNFNHLDLEINLNAAFKVIQTKLQPLERAVFLLKEVFDFDYDALQQTLNRNKEHCRQLFCRARKKLEDETAAIHPGATQKSQLLASFRKACDLDNASDLIGELKKEISTAIRKKF